MQDQVHWRRRLPCIGPEPINPGPIARIGGDAPNSVGALPPDDHQAENGRPGCISDAAQSAVAKFASDARQDAQPLPRGLVRRRIMAFSKLAHGNLSVRLDGYGWFRWALSAECLQAGPRGPTTCEPHLLVRAFTRLLRSLERCLAVPRRTPGRLRGTSIRRGIGGARRRSSPFRWRCPRKGRVGRVPCHCHGWPCRSSPVRLAPTSSTETSATAVLEACPPCVVLEFISEDVTPGGWAGWPGLDARPELRGPQRNPPDEETTP